MKFLNKKKIEYSVTLTNWYSFKIYLKFWDKHESRDQLKVWGKETLNVNLDNALDVIREIVETKYSKWYSMQWIRQLFLNLQLEVPNIVEPIFIQKWNIEDNIEIKQTSINNSDNLINKTTYKINKNDKKLVWWEKSKFWRSLFPKRVGKIQTKLKSLNDDLKTESNSKRNKALEMVILKEEYDNLMLHTHEIRNDNFVQHIDKINQDLTYKPINEFLKHYDNKNKTKGIYIIFNSSKNKYYVGQTKDIHKRICTQHFDYKSGQCTNDNFANDFNNGDKFYVHIKEIETKDDLDAQEKHYINVFDSFNNGYNKTGGNI